MAESFATEIHDTCIEDDVVEQHHAPSITRIGIGNLGEMWIILMCSVRSVVWFESETANKAQCPASS